MKKFFLFLLILGAIEIIGGLIYGFITDTENYMTHLKNIIYTLKNLSAESRISLIGFIVISAIVIAYFVLSIVLYRKRHYLIGQFDSGVGICFGTFIWAAFLIAPVWLLAPEIIKLIKGEQMNYWILLTPLYSVIPIIYFIKITNGEPFTEKVRLFFFMLGVGITCPMFILYKFLSIMTEPSHNKKKPAESYPYPSSSNNYDKEGRYYGDTNKNNTYIFGAAKNCQHYDGNGSYSGYTTNDGLHYDGNGSYSGYTTKDGLHYDGNGSYSGYTTKDGLHYDANGSYSGYTTKDGLHYDANGSYVGYTSK